MRSPQLAEDVTADPAVVSLTRLARVILQRRRLLFALLLTGIGVTLALALLQKRTYTATSSFMPQSRRVPNNLSGLAAQFGVALPNEGSVPPAFYADLLDSRAILAPLATDTFTVEIDGRPRQSHLVDLFHVKARTPALEREGVLLKLQDAVESSAAQKTGVVTLSVRTNYPDLSRSLNARLLTALNRFNLETRQSQAAAERRFTERRVAEVKADLRASEDRLLAFSQANRRIQDSPDLIAQRARLERDVTMQQQIYTTLAQAYEQAKIEEVRDTPVLTVITPPEVPARPDSRRLAVKGALLTALLLLFGVGVAITTDSMRNDGDEADRAMLGDEWRRTRSDLLRPHRLIFGSRPARSV